MISLLITLLIIVLIFGVAYWAISLLPLPPPFQIIAQVVIAIILLIVLLTYLLPLARHGVALP